MEPVSLAFGVVGVLCNIIDTSIKIRHQVASYKAATTDIQSILTKVDLIYQICQSLKSDINFHNCHHDIRDRALAVCHSSVLNIHLELAKLTTKGQSRRGKFDWLMKKSTIEKSVGDLNESIHLLNSYMLLRISGVRAVQTSKPILLNAKKSGPGEKSLSTDLPVGLYRKRPPPVASKTTSTIAQTKGTSYQNVLFLYQTAFAQTKDEHNIDMTETRSYLVGIPLLDTYIHLAMKRGPLNPWKLTLTTPRFIYEGQDKSLYDSIMTVCCLESPSEELKWIQKHGLSANTNLVPRAWGKEGEIIITLLGAMVALGREHAVDGLLAQGASTLGDKQHFSFLWSCRLRCDATDEGSSGDPAIRYVSMRGSLLTFTEYKSLAKLGRNPQYIKTLFDSAKDFISDVDEDTLIMCTADAVLDSFIVEDDPFTTSGKSDFSPLISELVGLGLDTTQSFELHGDRPSRFGRTALYKILNWPLNPVFVALENAKNWISCLEKASVPTDDYLKSELHAQLRMTKQTWSEEEYDNWDLVSRIEKLESLYYLVNLDLWGVASRVASDDLIWDAMPSFRYMSRISFDPGLSIDDYTHLAWKKCREDASSSPSTSSWPLQTELKPNLGMAGFSKDNKEWAAKVTSSYEDYMYLYNSRAERRQEKKWIKLKKRNGLCEEKAMPGSWKMEWWDYRGPW